MVPRTVWPWLALSASRGRAHQHVGVAVHVGGHVVVGLLDGVGQDESAGHEGDTEDHGNAGQEEPCLVGADGLDGESASVSGSQGAHAVEHGIGGRIGEVIDDAPVGKEHGRSA